MRRCCQIAFVVVAAASPLAGQPPRTPANPEIYLLSLIAGDGKISVGRPVNVTNRPGYDNQPAFSPNGRELFFTSVREDSQADIYRYDIAAKTTSRLTRTAPESEYSATVMPSRERLSVIRVEKDSTQRLWSFTLGGADDRLVIPDVKPVGYHAWIDPFHVALYVLGKPSSVVLVDTKTMTPQIVGHDVGRSLLPLPDARGFTFVARHDSAWMLTEVRLAGDSVRYSRPLVALPEGMDFVAWVGTTLVGGSGSKLLAWKRGGHWTEVADLSDAGLTHITRIAVSPDRHSLAIVAEPAGAKQNHPE